MLLRRVRGRQSGGRRVRDLNAPVSNISIHLVRYVVMCITHDTSIPINGGYPLIRILLEQFACDKLLECEHNAIFAPDADCCASVLDCFHCVLDLEVAAIGGEDGVGQVVACAY
jgi:hypothetical protein